MRDRATSATPTGDGVHGPGRPFKAGAGSPTAGAAAPLFGQRPRDGWSEGNSGTATCAPSDRRPTWWDRGPPRDASTLSPRRTSGSERGLQRAHVGSHPVAGAIRRTGTGCDGTGCGRRQDDLVLGYRTFRNGHGTVPRLVRRPNGADHSDRRRVRPCPRGEQMTQPPVGPTQNPDDDGPPPQGQPWGSPQPMPASGPPPSGQPTQASSAPMAPPPVGQEMPTAPRQSKSKRRWPWAVAAVVVAFGVGTAAGGGTDEPTTKAEAAPTAAPVTTTVVVTQPAPAATPTQPAPAPVQ